MFDFFKSFFRPEKPSSTTAKERLRLVLLSDHISLSPEIIESLKADLLAVISRYVEIDSGSADVTFEHRENEIAMLASVPITGLRDGRPGPPPPDGRPGRPQPADAEAPSAAVASATAEASTVGASALESASLAVHAPSPPSEVEPVALAEPEPLSAGESSLPSFQEPQLEEPVAAEPAREPGSPADARTSQEAESLRAVRGEAAVEPEPPAPVRAEAAPDAESSAPVRAEAASDAAPGALTQAPAGVVAFAYPEGTASFFRSETGKAARRRRRRKARAAAAAAALQPPLSGQGLGAPAQA